MNPNKYSILYDTMLPRTHRPTPRAPACSQKPQRMSGLPMHTHTVERYFVAQPLLIQLCVCDAVHPTACTHRRKKVQEVVDTRARRGRGRTLFRRDEDRGCWVQGEEIEKDTGQARGPVGVYAIADDDHVERVSRGQRRVALALPVWTPAEREHLHWCNVLT